MYFGSQIRQRLLYFFARGMNVTPRRSPKRGTCSDKVSVKSEMEGQDQHDQVSDGEILFLPLSDSC